jgi:two-component system OmpR family response regulator
MPMDAFTDVVPADASQRAEPVGQRLLVVVPEAGGRDRVGLQLSFAGYDVTSVGNGREALRLLEDHQFALIVADLEIPDRDLLAGRPRLAGPDRPGILVLVGCELLSSLVPELGVTVEDYITKPWHPAELLARVQVLLRHRSPAVGEPRIRQADLVIDQAVCRAWRSGRPLDLTPAEFRLLRQLVVHNGRVLSKEQLARQVWGEDRDHNTIERLVSRLRQKVDRNGDEPVLIRTRRGFGYWLESTM